MRHLRHPATLISLLALFFSLSGGAFALVITGRMVKNGSLTGADIKDGSIAARDLARSARLTGPAGPAGATGAAGPAGHDGAVGPQGLVGAAGPEGPPSAAGARGPAGPAGTPGNQGNAGPRGTTGPDGAPGASGDTGPTGPSAIAYGQIETDGSLTANSGVADADIVHTAGSGVWCIRAAGRWGSVMVAADNSDANNTTIVSAFVEHGTSIQGCDLSDGQTIRIRTASTDGTLSDKPFLFWLSP